MHIEIQRKIIDTYSKLYSLSKKRHHEFVKYMPNGCVRHLSYYDPFPIHIEKGEGAYVVTKDGYKLFDLVNGYGTLIHGHVQPKVTNVAINSIKRGTLFSTPSEILYKYVKQLNSRLPSMEKMLICNSGTEATLFALRTARAVKKKSKILKIKNGYHGLHDCIAISPSYSKYLDKGITKGMLQDVIEVDFNDFDAFEAAVEANAKDLAAVIIEPFLGAGGIIPPRKGYMEFVRKITYDNDVFLILDEIISFRIHENGAQGYFNITPDITTLGKFVGGGYPIGVFGGKAEIMNVYDYNLTKDALYHSGTFNGYETALHAGYAALECYDYNEINKLNKLAEVLFDRLTSIIKELNLAITVTKFGSFLKINLVDKDPYHINTPEGNSGLMQLFHLSLLNKKYYITPRGMIVLSTPMTEREIIVFSKVVGETFTELLPLIRSKYSYLIVD